MKIPCLIVDDEPLAIDVIENHLSYFSGFKIVGRCRNAVEAFECLKNNKVALMFLDIQMPGVSGVNFVSSLKNPPQIIFTTAYREYALEGFNLNALDYLLKPISLERFIQAIDKFYALHAPMVSEVGGISSASGSGHQSIFVKTERKMVRIFLDEIYYIESLKEYVILYLKDKKVITKTSLTYLESVLPGEHFCRIHRSYIVAVQKISAYTQVSIEVLQKELPIGRNYKVDILQKFLPSH